MDFSKVINQELGIKDKVVKSKITDSAAKAVVNRQEEQRVLPSLVERVPFDISKYVPNKYLQEALKRFHGSILNVSPINGAIEFIFGK